MIGTTEIIIIALVVFVLFGASSIPKFAKSIGQAKAAFQDGVREGQEEKEKERKKKSATASKSSNSRNNKTSA